MKKLIFGLVICGYLVYHKVSTFLLRFVVVVTSLYQKLGAFYVNVPIYLIILLENQVFTPDLLVGKLSKLKRRKCDYFHIVKIWEKKDMNLLHG